MPDGVVLTFALAAVVAVGVAVVAWRRRARTPAAGVLTAVSLGVALWSLASAGRLVAPSADAFLVARGLQFAGVYGTAAALWCLARAGTRPGWRVSRRTLAALALPAVALLALWATNGLHEVMAADTIDPAHPDTLVDRPRAGFWLGLAWAYGLMVAATGSLLRSWRRAGWYERRQLRTLVVSTMPPVVVSLVPVVASATGRPVVDWTPLGFLVTALLCTWALTRQGWTSILPVARAQVLEEIADAVAVVDRAGVLVDLNREATRLARMVRPGLAEPFVGRPATDVLSGDVLEPPGPDGEGRLTVALAPDLHVDARTSVLADARGRDLGRVVVVRDVTATELRRARLEDATARLRAQGEVLLAANARLTDQLAVNAVLRERLAEDAARDPLTGVHNRRGLEPALAAALAEARGLRSAASVLLVDLDHFKEVNDRHGHEAGDRVLRAVSAALVDAAGGPGTVVRLGGEEFVVVLPATDRRAALRRAEDLRAACARLRVPLRREDVVSPAPTVPTAPVAPVGVAPVARSTPAPAPTIGVTVSVGVATGPGDGETPDALLAAADAALYAAKAAGRDVVVAASAASPR
ncbi:histidine kinase N-terminal 7TM domain-containing diguanylate cyclase [Cellulomonas marina]|uniref:Diguanylate cyclase (GGDEF) domain-containing protein n=1 Tax=Cellulomonas marina TaxID=988821 RepID=A0A1I0YHZ0_9CELL|nr:diguanylate cyclase [Cellulomonas marina]GIG28694.1 hypothetical protein Cma02nite_12940 [Cellulomonas marina]SFB12366.1 diguanylate cyclase (GGDEF) domain-containing protein [Cellulomonas marina]